ncbi:DUF6572 domain-containing protein [Anaerosinus massiliensis]|uniref:DUF6572 domain-containing protein n=1 Tax=Massilibacillus massiliensis TaxID=1806837 RepID=UPI000DA5FC32|nr:DUF6572 domain-containing protein [Massilibacillus massiliensis]
MSLKQVDVLDYISVNKASGHVVLTISDDLSWEEPDRHLVLLQDKLNFYLGFIESDQIYVDYPDARDRKFDIRIYSQYNIPDIGIDFMKKVANLFQRSGYGLSVKEAIPNSEGWLDIKL